MRLTGKLIISLVVAAIASALLLAIQEGNTPYLTLFGVIAAATIATSLLGAVKINPPTPSATTEKSTKNPARNKPKAVKKPSPEQPKPASSGPREEGEVKWFNVTKGFGFITRGNGEEIFVHFRSIRGEGRRSLRDGQRVSYVVADSDKGPQAEDVEGLD